MASRRWACSTSWWRMALRPTGDGITFVSALSACALRAGRNGRRRAQGLRHHGRPRRREAAGALRLRGRLARPRRAAVAGARGRLESMPFENGEDLWPLGPEGQCSALAGCTTTWRSPSARLNTCLSSTQGTLAGTPRWLRCMTTPEGGTTRRG